VLYSGELYTEFGFMLRENPMNLLEIETLRKQASGGDAAAQLELGYLYAFGIDVPQDNAEAVKWYQCATMHDSVISMHAHYALGKHYSHGRGVAKNNEKAMRYFRLAAEKGLSEAQFSLAECYYLGNGTSRNPSEAAKWYGLAAQQCLAIAQFKLGLRYSKGDGVPKNTLFGYMWLNISAVEGDPYAKRCRDFLEMTMTRDQIMEAQKMSSDWMMTHCNLS
jgi:uncharacterized protein